MGSPRSMALMAAAHRREVDGTQAAVVDAQLRRRETKSGWPHDCRDEADGLDMPRQLSTGMAL